MADSIRLPEESLSNWLGIECVKISTDGTDLMIPTAFTRDPLASDPAVDIANDYANMMARGEETSLRGFLNEMLQNDQLRRALSENATYRKSFSNSLAKLLR